MIHDLGRRSARTALVTLCASTLLVGGVSPAAADHVVPRDIADACPSDRPGADERRFADTEGTTFHREIVCVNDYAIANGVGDGRYAPNDPITRQQMALFLFRLAVSAHLPLNAADNQFGDIGAAPQEVRDAINVVAHLGIAQGVRPATFDPAGTVTRGQMASFLNRFHAVATGTDGFPPGDDAFDDDDGSVHEPAIDAAAAAGLASGLGGEQDRLFAPGRALTRGQMAGFLARLLDAEVEAGTIGSRFVEAERIEGVAVGGLDTQNRVELDTDGDGAADRQIFYDGNDQYLFGDQAGSLERFRGESQLGVLSLGDRLSVSYLPNFHDTSTVTVVDDLVDPPFPVFATALVGEDGVQDDVRVVWSHYLTDVAVVERYRAPAGADGACPADTAAYVADGTVDEPRSRSDLFVGPGDWDQDRTDPAVVDADVPGDACYRYRVRSVSDEVRDSTPSEPSAFTNAVLVGGPVDDTGPALTDVEVVQNDEAGQRIALTFDGEDQLVFTDLHPGVVLYCYAGSKNGYQVPWQLIAQEGPRLTFQVTTPVDLSTCNADVWRLALADEKGNPTSPGVSRPITAR